MKKHRQHMKHATQKRSIPVPALDTRLGSHIEDHKYCAETGHLTVTFAGGRSYRYEGVSQETADGLASAESKGRYLHASVIGKHSAVKI